MIIEIEHDGVLLAILIRAGYDSDGIEFFTPPEFSQQLAYMKRPSGYEITPHVHNSVPREVEFTKEVLFIKSGKVRVDFYNDQKHYIESRILQAGDIILLAFGGHGFRILEEAEIIEVKQGPYAGENDKMRFDSVSDEQVTIL